MAAACLPPLEKGRSPAEGGRVGIIFSFDHLATSDPHPDPYPDPPLFKGRERTT